MPFLKASGRDHPVTVTPANSQLVIASLVTHVEQMRRKTRAPQVLTR